MFICRKIQSAKWIKEYIRKSAKEEHNRKIAIEEYDRKSAIEEYIGKCSLSQMGNCNVETGDENLARIIEWKVLYV